MNKQNINDLNKNDFDSPWKDMLENYFSEFMYFFFPQAYNDIEWQKHYKFLDKEFQQITQDSEVGRRSVDKLVEVCRKNGEESWVLVHVEIQGQRDIDFAKRMYTYNYRIFDRYNRSVASLAILSDENPNWRPNQFSYSLWGCNVGIEFPAIKLLDYQDQWNELEESRNPFAVAVMAHLKVQETRNNYEERKRWKFYLARRLYERGYKREDIIQLLKFIDWIMFLPKDLENGFWQEIHKYEEGKKMPYMLSIERIVLEREIKESLFDALEIKYERIPEKLAETINSIEEIDSLRILLRHAIKCNSLEEFEEKMRSVIG